MGYAGCSVFGCKAPKRVPRHQFPNPKTHFELFRAWKKACNSPVLNKLLPHQIHRKRFICDKHFLEDEKTVYNNLLPDAIPTLFIMNQPQFLQAKKQDVINDHNYSNMEVSFTSEENHPIDLTEEENEEIIEVASLDSVTSNEPELTPGTLICIQAYYMVLGRNDVHT